MAAGKGSRTPPGPCGPMRGADRSRLTATRTGDETLGLTSLFTPEGDSTERVTGFEPATFCLGSRRATNCATLALNLPPADLIRLQLWCPEGDLNPHALRAHGPKPCVSANSTIGALHELEVLCRR